MKKVAITLIATLMMLGVSWSANSANIEGTTNGGKRVLLNEDGTWKYIKSKQDKVNEARADLAVEAMREFAKSKKGKLSVPYAGCYRSEFLRFVNRDLKSVSKKHRKLLEILTVDNLNRMIEMFRTGEYEKKIDAVFKKKKGDVFTKDEEIIGVSMYLIHVVGITKCEKLIK